MRTIILLLLLGAAGRASLCAQTAVGRFERLSVEDGLRGSEVTAILQDRRGFIWVGTSGGLSRYDGYSVDTYTSEPDDPNSLIHNWVLDLHEDQEGVLWIATGGGLNRFEPASGTFVRYVHDPEDPYSLSPGSANSIHGDQSGRLWIGTSDGGLNLFVPSEQRFIRYRHEPDDPSSLSHDRVTFICSDRRGMLWVGTAGGLSRFDPATERFMRYTHTAGLPTSLIGDDVRTILVDRAGMLWVGTTKGLDRYDHETGTFTHYRHDPRDPRSLSEDLVHYLYEDRSGTLWVGTAGGLNGFDRETGTFTHYRHDPSDPHSLSSDWIYAIYEDRQGILWVGTADGGLNRHDPATRAFRHLKRSAGSDNSLSHRSVRALLEDREGRIWVGTQGGGLSRLEPDWDEPVAGGEVERYTRYQHDPRREDRWCDNDVEVLAQTRDGMIWAGTGGGLCRLDPESGSTVRYRHQEPDPASLPADAVYALHQDQRHGGNLWVGTAAGLSRFDPAAQTFIHFRPRSDEAPHAGSNSVYVIHEDQRGLFWIGTGAGLYLFDPASGRFLSGEDGHGRMNGLRQDWITSIYEDPEGTLWVGTYGGGLAYFDPDGPDESSRVTRQNSELPDNVIYCMVGSSEGHLWLSTNRGLSRFDPARATFKNYQSGDGLQSNEFNRAACYQGKHGRLYFGGVNGFNAFLAEELQDNPHPPEVLLTGIELFDPSVQSRRRLPLLASVDEIVPIALSPRQNDLSIAYVGLHFSNPERNRYAYQLEPYDDTWRQVGAQRTATYTNLDPGTYTFRVKAANSDGIWNEEGASLRFVIRPRFYQTRLFHVLSALAFVVFGLGIYRLRVRHLAEQQQKLRRQVQERTQALRLEKEKTETALRDTEQARREAEQARMTVEVQASQLRVLDEAKSRFFANLSHEFRTPLTLILSPLEQALSEDAIDERLRPVLQTAHDQARRLLDLISQLLDVSRIEAGRMPLRTRRANLASFLERLVQSFTVLAEQKRIDLQFEVSGRPGPLRSEFEVYFDADKLERVFNNLLSNAFKFTPKHGKVVVAVNAPAMDDAGREEICVEVRDTGRGIPPEELPRLFDRFHQVDASLQRPYEGAGIGLSLARDLVELHGGRIICHPAALTSIRVRSWATGTIRFPGPGLCRRRGCPPRRDRSPSRHLRTTSPSETAAYSSWRMTPLCAAS